MLSRILSHEKEQNGEKATFGQAFLSSRRRTGRTPFLQALAPFPYSLSFTDIPSQLQKAGVYQRCTIMSAPPEAIVEPLGNSAR